MCCGSSSASSLAASVAFGPSAELLKSLDSIEAGPLPLARIYEESRRPLKFEAFGARAVTMIDGHATPRDVTSAISGPINGDIRTGMREFVVVFLRKCPCDVRHAPRTGDGPCVRDRSVLRARVSGCPVV